MERMIERQGGDPAVVEKPQMLVSAPIKVGVFAERDGFVTGIDSLELGLAAVQLGAGRTRAEQAVDHAVGIDLTRKPGDSVRAGEELCVIAARSGDVPVERVRAAFSIGDSAPEGLPLVLDRIVS
jgi:pyrimidine-nucleoside phosphorylase